jgi:hypothetical protein
MERVAAFLPVLVVSSFGVTYTSRQSSARVSSDSASRVLPARPPSVGLTLSTGQLVPAIELLAWYVRVPIGFEGLDGDPFVSASPSDELQLGGYAVAEALDKIVAEEPRYRWTKTMGSFTYGRKPQARTRTAC